MIDLLFCSSLSLASFRTTCRVLCTGQMCPTVCPAPARRATANNDLPAEHVKKRPIYPAVLPADRTVAVRNFKFFDSSRSKMRRTKRRVRCDVMLQLTSTTRAYVSAISHNSKPRAGSGVVRIDPLRFLTGCRTRRLNQVLLFYILACFYCVVI